MSEKKNTNVYLAVDTANITQPTKDNNVVFSDDRGDPGEISGHPSTYVSSVDKSKNIIWSGTADNKTDVINITKVAKKPVGGGSDILKKASYTADNGSRTVTGKVKDKDVTGDECYNITFNINGDANKTFTIDPRLKMKNAGSN